jgi:hypothetical protein
MSAPHRLYQHPGIAATVNMDHIKRRYYMTHGDINPSRIVPQAPSWISPATTAAGICRTTPSIDPPKLTPVCRLPRIASDG